MRKQLQAEHGKADLEKQIELLEAKKKEQTSKIIELKSKIEAIDQRSASNRDVDTKKRHAENQFLKQQCEHLSKFLRIIQTKWETSKTNREVDFT